MRLNFSAVSENHIVEGIRRIGKVIDEQISLYGTISGRAAGRSTGRGPEERGDTPDSPPPNVVQFPQPIDTKRGARR
jgi:2-aminoadipate transaminase